MAAKANGNHESCFWAAAGDTAIAPDGSTIFVKGSDTLEAGPGGAPWAAVPSRSTGRPSSTWRATSVEGFVSYGTALPGSKLPPPPATGGKAKLHVSFSNGQNGVLTIFCRIGSPPPSVGEGIKLVLGSGLSGEYTTEGTGITIFKLL
jgi:hypothetical protein